MRQLSLIFVFLGSTYLSAQTTTPVVVASSGDYFVGTDATLSWTLGEIMTETYDGSNNQLTQGFQQPLRVTSGLEEVSSQLNVNVYPNPTQANLTLEIPDNTDEISIEIYDAAGKLVVQQIYSGVGPQTINFEELSNGLYIMRLKDDNNILETIKIQKTK